MRAVTVLQRSPTYFYAGPNANELADMLRQLDLPDEWVHEIVRRKLLFDSHALIQLSLDEPELVREELIRMVTELLPEGYDVAPTSPPATTRGASGWRSCPTATCSPGSRSGGPRW